MAFESKRNIKPAGREPLRKLEGVSRELSTVQRNVDDATRKAREMPQTRGRRVSVTFTATSADTKVAHGLGRRPRGYQVESQDGAADIHQTASDNRTITLQSDALVTVKLWVY